MIGVFEAIASSNTRPNPSYSEVNANTSENSIISLILSENLIQIIFSSIHNSDDNFFKLLVSGPDPTNIKTLFLFFF